MAPAPPAVEEGPGRRGLLDAIIDIQRTARGTYGVRPGPAELALGRQLKCCRQRVERLTRLHGLQGVHRRRWRHAHRSPSVFQDLVQRRFTADSRNRLWVTDITRHREDEAYQNTRWLSDTVFQATFGNSSSWEG